MSSSAFDELDGEATNSRWGYKLQDGGVKELNVNVIDGPVYLVRLRIFVCFFISKRTNDKLPFARLAYSKRIKANAWASVFCFPFETAAYIQYIVSLFRIRI
jgi:hypothetical protein